MTLDEVSELNQHGGLSDASVVLAAGQVEQAVLPQALTLKVAP